MKKIITSILLAVVLCLGCVMLAACGEETAIEIGANGNWIINGTDSGIKAEGSNGKDGAAGSAVTVGANGNWFIDGVDTGIVAVPEKYVTDVQTVTEQNPDTGVMMIKTVLTYNDGSTAVQYKEIPYTVDDIYWEYTGPFYVGYEPLLFLNVWANSYNITLTIPVTDDMWQSEKPDFTKPGIYEVLLSYCGAQCTGTFEVREAPEDLKINSAYLDYKIKSGTPFAEVGAIVQFNDDSTSYRVSLDKASYVSVSDFNWHGEKTIAMTFDGETYYSPVYAYEMGVANACYCTLQNASYVNDLINVGDSEAFDALKKDLVEHARLYVDLAEYIGGRSYRYIDVTADMLDVSDVDITKPGKHELRIYAEDPIAGKLVHKIEINVGTGKLNSSSKLYLSSNTYLSGQYAEDLALYENGVAIYGGMACNYEREGNTVVLYNYYNAYGGKVYLTVDDDTQSFDAMQLADKVPTARYTNEHNVIRFDVYEDYVQLYYVEDAEHIYLAGTLSNEIEEDSFIWHGNKVTLFNNGTWYY